jgi:hypothetical protein
MVPWSSTKRRLEGLDGASAAGSAAGKVIVFGIIKRNGQVKAMPTPGP